MPETAKDPPPIIDRMAKAMQKSCTGREDGWAEQVSSAYAALDAMMEPTLAMRRVSSFSAAEYDWPAMIRAASNYHAGVGYTDHAEARQRLTPQRAQCIRIARCS